MTLVINAFIDTFVSDPPTSPVVALERYGPTEKTQGGLQAVPGVEILIVKQNDTEELANGEEVYLPSAGNFPAGDKIKVIYPNLPHLELEFV